MSLLSNIFELIDKANAEDPNSVEVNGKEWKKEQLYSTQMLQMLQRFFPQAEDIHKIAVYAQHIQRWKSPRSDYPMNKAGYYQWRTALYDFHANIIADLMAELVFDKESIVRVKDAVGKKNVQANKDTQLLEDIAALVFIEYYMQDFVEKNTDYSEEKWFGIIAKTWSKMSPEAQEFALSGELRIPGKMIPLIMKAIS